MAWIRNIFLLFAFCLLWTIDNLDLVAFCMQSVVHLLRSALAGAFKKLSLMNYSSGWSMCNKQMKMTSIELFSILSILSAFLSMAHYYFDLNFILTNEKKARSKYMYSIHCIQKNVFISFNWLDSCLYLSMFRRH